MKPLRFTHETIILLAILTLGLALRLWGVGFGLPHLYHADEPIVVNHALAYGTGDLNPHFFKIPPLVSYLLFFCYGLYFAFGRGIGCFHSVRDFEHLFYFDPSVFYLIARLVFGVGLGVATVYLLFKIAKRIGGGTAALWASFFLAINFLHVRDSHYIYADIPLVLVLVAGFFVFFKMGQEGPPEGRKGTDPFLLHLCAGCMIGLATAIKYNGVFLAIPYLWISCRQISWKKWLPFWFVAGVGASVTFFLLNPYALLDHAFFVKEIVEQSAANSGGLPWSHHLTYSLAGGMGWPMLIVGLVGTLWAFFSKSWKSQAVAVFVVGYYLVLCKFGQPYDRYVLPLIPFLLILAVEVLLKIQKRSRLVFWILIPFVTLPSILKVVHWDRLMSERDVRTVGKAWGETHIPEGSRIALDWGFYMPRLAFSQAQLDEKRAVTAAGVHAMAKSRRLDAFLAKPYHPSYELYFLSAAPDNSGFLFGQPKIPFDLSVLKEKGVEYVFLIEGLRPEDDPFFKELQANADRIMTFSPYRDSADLTLHDGITMTGGPFLWGDILPRKRGGYPFSIYKIRS